MFRYSGSKRRVLKHLPPPPRGTWSVVEPFAGSLAYSLHHRPLHIVAAEANPQVRELWEWLRSPQATEARLMKLESLRPTDKVDARVVAAAHGLIEAEQTLLRLQISGVIVGQLSSWQLNPQNTLDLTYIKQNVYYVKLALDKVREDFRDPVITMAANAPGAMAFIDPPYAETSANYKSSGVDHGGLDAPAVTAFVKGLKCPVLFTYGDGAQETFPDFTWQEAMKRQVPILRGGGTRERTEWYALENWR